MERLEYHMKNALIAIGLLVAAPLSGAQKEST
jgi:hypothetical protein